MLESYYTLPCKVDEIRALWLGQALDAYAGWLAERRISKARGQSLIQSVLRFGLFAEKRGVRSLDGIPPLIEPFVQSTLRRLGTEGRHDSVLRAIVATARSSLEQLLAVSLPGYARPSRLLPWPLESRVPEFLTYLREERGLRKDSLRGYAVHIRFFEHFLDRKQINDLSTLTPKLVSQFLIESTRHCGPGGKNGRAGALRVLLKFLHRQRRTPTDLSSAVPRGRSYKFARLPRAIPWSEVQRVLASVDRRSAIGKRNYAMLQLLATYGLRPKDVAKLELSAVAWETGQFRIYQRKAGNSTSYPLATHVGEALIDYLRNARPQSTERFLFLSAVAPFGPIDFVCASHVARSELVRAGIQGQRLGSHTFRHSCAQRLVEADVPFKHIGDYMGHRRESTTQIYAKVAVHKLRELATGDAEEAL